MAQPAGTEPKLGVIPRVVKYGFGGIREYSILLTDRRFIFVLASLNRMFLVAAAIGGAIGAAVAGPASRDASSKSMSYIFNDDAETLAALPNGLVIRYDGIRRLLLKKYPADYELVIDYVNEAGKKEGIRLQLKVPDEVDVHREPRRGPGPDLERRDGLHVPGGHAEDDVRAIEHPTGRGDHDEPDLRVLARSHPRARKHLRDVHEGCQIYRRLSHGQIVPADVFGLARFVDPDLGKGHPDIRPRAGIVLDRDVETAFVQVDVRREAGDRDDGGQRDGDEGTSHTHPPQCVLGRGGR